MRSGSQVSAISGADARALKPQGAASGRRHRGRGTRPGRAAAGGPGRSSMQTESLDEECTVPAVGMDTSRLTGQPLLLVGFDGSAAAWRAAAWALGQARCQRARLVYVYISVIPAWAGLEPQLVPQWRASLAKLAAGIADQLEAVLGEAGVSWNSCTARVIQPPNLPGRLTFCEPTRWLSARHATGCAEPGSRWPAGFCDRGTGRSR